MFRSILNKLYRNYSERVRNDVVRLLRETDEKTTTGQKDAGFQIGARITDVTFWRNELNVELEKLVAETALLSSIKRNIAKAEQVFMFYCTKYLNLLLKEILGSRNTSTYCPRVFVSSRNSMRS